MREMLTRAVDIQYSIKYKHLEEDQEMPEEEGEAKENTEQKVPDM